jgi:hypothetical protein
MSLLTAAQQSSWSERGFIRIGGFAAAETCAAMLQRVTDVARDPGLAEELGVKVLPESNKAGVPVAHPEDGVSKIFRLHRDPVFARFALSADVVDLVSELIAPTSTSSCRSSSSRRRAPGGSPGTRTPSTSPSSRRGPWSASGWP